MSFHYIAVLLVLHLLRYEKVVVFKSVYITYNYLQFCLMSTLDNLPAWQVFLAHSVPKFDKAYLHCGLTSYNRNTGKAKV